MIFGKICGKIRWSVFEFLTLSLRRLMTWNEQENEGWRESERERKWNSVCYVSNVATMATMECGFMRKDIITFQRYCNEKSEDMGSDLRFASQQGIGTGTGAFWNIWFEITTPCLLNFFETLSSFRCPRPCGQQQHEIWQQASMRNKNKYLNPHQPTIFGKEKTARQSHKLNSETSSLCVHVQYMNHSRRKSTAIGFKLSPAPETLFHHR